jgi:hypothetical protein
MLHNELSTPIVSPCVPVKPLDFELELGQTWTH